MLHGHGISVVSMEQSLSAVRVHKHITTHHTDLEPNLQREAVMLHDHISSILVSVNKHNSSMLTPHNTSLHSSTSLTSTHCTTHTTQHYTTPHPLNKCNKPLHSTRKEKTKQDKTRQDTTRQSKTGQHIPLLHSTTRHTKSYPITRHHTSPHHPTLQHTKTCNNA